MVEGLRFKVFPGAGMGNRSSSFFLGDPKCRARWVLGCMFEKGSLAYVWRVFKDLWRVAQGSKGVGT